MEAVLLLANSAEASPNGLVHALGLGWSVTSSPTPPAAVIVLLQVPWDQTNMRHKFRLSLVDADGHGVMLGQDPLSGQPAPLSIEGEFEAGRPPGLPHGTPIDQQLTLNIGPLPLPPGQAYEWRLEINGGDVAARRFMVRPTPGPNPFVKP